MTPQEELELYKALMRQISGMYDNPELKRICQEAGRGNWSSVFYEKYKPDSLKKKVKEKQEG